MSYAPKVYIIILNWNGLKDTLECIESVYKLNYPNFDIIVVDNGSTDDSPEMINRTYPSITLIKNETNCGYTGGNNIGMRYAMAHNADYIWLLNNDTIVELECLNKLVKTVESSNMIGLVSPIIYYFENPAQWQFAGSYMNWKKFSLVFPNQNEKVDDEFQNGKHVCLWGTALLVKRSLIQQIGYLKEEYFAYWEDTEYSLRVLRAGFQNIVCGSAKVFHKSQLPDPGGKRKKKHFYYFVRRNGLLLGNEYLKRLSDRISFQIRYFADVSDYIGKCHVEYIEACLDGTWHGFKGISGPMRNEHRMPKFYKKVLLFMSKYHPVFIADLIRLDFREMYQKILRKIRAKKCPKHCSRKNSIY